MMPEKNADSFFQHLKYEKTINLEKELTFGQDDLYLTLFISLNSNFGPRIFCVIFYNLFSVDRSDDKTHPGL